VPQCVSLSGAPCVGGGGTQAKNQASEVKLQELKLFEGAATLSVPLVCERNDMQSKTELS